MRRSLAIALAPLLGLLLVVTGATTASASVHRNDGHDAPYAFDTQRVALYPNYDHDVVVQMYSRTYHVGRQFNGLIVNIDSIGGPGTDYRVDWAFGKDGDHYTNFHLYRASGSRDVAIVNCPGLDARGRKHIHAIEIHIPRSCLAISKRVGVRTLALDYVRYRRDGSPLRSRVDYAPNRGWLR